MKFARYLAALGWGVDVLTVKPIRYHAYDPSLLEEIAEVPVHRTGSLEPLRLMWLGGWRPPPPRLARLSSFGDLEAAANAAAAVPAAGRIYRRVVSALLQPDEQVLWVPFARAAAAALYRRGGYDVILTTSPPESCHFVGAYVQRSCGVPWVADFRDAWANHHLRPKGLIGACHKRWEKNVVQAAAAVVANTDDMASYFAAVTGRTDIVIIPNGYDDADKGPPLPKARPGDFVLVHNGSFRGGRRALPLLEGFARARERSPAFRAEARLYLIGINRSDDAAAARGLGLEGNAFFVPYLPHRETVRACLGADALLLCMAACEASTIVPGKLYEYFGAGVPIIAAVPEGPARRLIERVTRGALIVDAEDGAAFADALVQAHRQKSAGGIDFRILPEEAEKYERRRQVETLAALLDRLS